MSSRELQIKKYRHLILLLVVALVPLVVHAQLKDPLESKGDIQQFALNVLQQGFFPVLGMAALVSVLWGAFQWITSGGSSERVKLGKDTFLWVVLGLLLASGSFVLLRFIIEVFVNSTAVR